jgi:hypothetical protein
MGHIAGGAGVCRSCGHGDAAACFIHDFQGRPIRCWWIDAGHTLCSNPACLAPVPLDELIRLSGTDGLFPPADPAGMIGLEANT